MTIIHLQKILIFPSIFRPCKSDVVLNIENNQIDDNFCNQFAFFVTIGQCVGLMPVKKVDKNGRYDFPFEWYSIRIIYSIVNVLSSFVLGVFCIIDFSVHGFQLDRTGTLMFYVMNFFGALTFINISRYWSYIMDEWTQTEIILKCYKEVKNFRRRLVITSAVVIILATAEHLLFILNDISKTSVCRRVDNNRIEEYFNVAHPQVFRLVTFSYWSAFLVKLANIISTVTWNYTDSFIILISCGLAVRFKQIAEAIQKKNFQDTDDKYWRETREDFNRLYQLCTVVDKHISLLVTVSFTNNIFFICIQLYNSLKDRKGFIEKAYYFYSFAFLLLRTASITLYGAWVNDESRKPIDRLHSVPHKQYNIEVSRFIDQISSIPIGITGSKLFIVTRGFLLKIIGTIITMELMLLQFGPLVKDDKIKSFNISNCWNYPYFRAYAFGIWGSGKTRGMYQFSQQVPLSFHIDLFEMLLENVDIPVENISTIHPIGHDYFREGNMKMGGTNVQKEKKYYTTNDCLRVLLVICQFFGVFPIHNAFDSDNNAVFKWSWKVIYTIFLALCFFVYSILSFVKALQEEGIFLYQMITPLYNLCICLILLTFIQIARDWQTFSKLVSKVENEFSAKYDSGPVLPRKIYFISCILLLAAFVEHALSIAFMVLSKNCDNTSTGWEYYLKKHFHYVYHYIDFNLAIGLICAVQSWMGAFIWNFCDVFIVVISIIMTERFHQITMRVKKYLVNQGLMFHSRLNSRRIAKLFVTDSIKSEIQFWSEVHVDYDKMCNIIHLLDEILSNLLLVSYSTNLIFILIRLFVSLRQMSSNVEIVYFYSSFACVISRTILVSIFGGLLNDETKSLVPYLNTASTQEYNDHMLRLLQQINFSNNALTGHNFFRVTKGSVLNVAAAIITYELVLIQFNQHSLEKMAYVENSTICF
ncbi:uncharacterized protein LOC123310843 [Coccinella septempunctata]|uniref:uncharacterized protein LOC123310843 n=1 Tax=Coccinella septempunctata TaxID=41139 RepID=UPI001D091CD6|nr:uncharacterized protein LOC123310843 [Coccinella septempunctata]